MAVEQDGAATHFAPDDGQSAEAPQGMILKAMINGIENGRNGSGTIYVFATGNGGASDDNCNFTGAGDLNNTDPLLGPLQYNGGPTQTLALPPGSPAVDAGDPNGCTDGLGHLLKTDQRAKPRPGTANTGCDMGAYERQSD